MVGAMFMKINARWGKWNVVLKGGMCGHIGKMAMMMGWIWRRLLFLRFFCWTSFLFACFKRLAYKILMLLLCMAAINYGFGDFWAFDFQGRMLCARQRVVESKCSR